jgi:hypothetical protein
MKALISPTQGNLVVDVVSTEFEVASPLFWVSCNDTVFSYQFVYKDGEFQAYIPPLPTAFENQQTAIKLLQETDWTSIPDIGNPELSNPYLTNQLEFLAWRSQVRAIAVNPVEGANIFPPKPQEQWSS